MLCFIGLFSGEYECLAVWLCFERFLGTSALLSINRLSCGIGEIIP
jgi:hypothetical protein